MCPSRTTESLNGDRQPGSPRAYKPQGGEGCRAVRATDPLLSFQHNEALHRPHSLLLGAGSPQPSGCPSLGRRMKVRPLEEAMASLSL